MRAKQIGRLPTQPQRNIRCLSFPTTNPYYVRGSVARSSVLLLGFLSVAFTFEGLSTLSVVEAVQHRPKAAVGQETLSAPVVSTASEGTVTLKSELQKPTLPSALPKWGDGLFARLMNFSSLYKTPKESAEEWLPYQDGHSGLVGELVDATDYNGDKKVDLFFLAQHYFPSQKTKGGRRKLVPWPFNIWWPDHDSGDKQPKEDGNKYLLLYLWNSDTKRFVDGTMLQVAQNVTSVITNDWNFDGYMDVITVGSSVQHGETVYSMLAYKQDPANHTLIQYFDFNNITSTIHPFATDLNGDGVIDIICQSRNEDGTGHERFAWLNRVDSFVQVSWNELFDLQYLRKGPKEGAYLSLTDKRGLSPTVQGKLEPNAAPSSQDGRMVPQKLASPHSSAFVDMDGDCRADIVLEVESGKSGRRELEIWLNDGFHSSSRSMYRLDEEHRVLLPAGAGQVTYADIDADGTLDLVVPVCDRAADGQCTGASRIYVAFNQQVPLCTPGLGFFHSETTDTNQANCRSVKALCAPSEFALPKFETLGNVEPGMATASAETGGARITVTALKDMEFKGSNADPVTVRVGDFDSDGYPDLIIVAKTANGQSSAKLFRNVELKNPDGEGHESHQDGGHAGMRVFEYAHDVAFGEKNEGLSVNAAAFVDVGEDGALDVVAVGRRKSESVPIGVLSLQAAGSSNGETLFLKATSLNGVKPHSDQLETQWWVGRPTKPLGGAARGATYKATVTDISGQKSLRSATQLPQSAHSPLGSPFVHFGLGRTNNYIDEFFFGMPIAAGGGDSDVRKTETGDVSQEEQNALEEKKALKKIVTKISRAPSDPYNMHLYSAKWMAIIPNSQVLTIPYRLNFPEEWMIELSLGPSQVFFSIFSATVTCLAVLGTIIWLLSRREKAEEMKEYQGFRRHFITA